MRRVRELREWANEYYMGVACMIVGIPLLWLIVMEIACWYELGVITQKIALLESMF